MNCSYSNLFIKAIAFISTFITYTLLFEIFDVFFYYIFLIYHFNISLIDS